MPKVSRAERASAAGSTKQLPERARPTRKRIPLRTCVVCRKTGSKRELVRVVRTPVAGVQVDASGKMAGRGAYLCRNKACWEQAGLGQRLGQALKTTLTAESCCATGICANITRCVNTRNRTLRWRSSFFRARIRRIDMLAAERPQPQTRCVRCQNVASDRPGEGNSQRDGNNRSGEVRMMR
jgi:predicted RNA-binding protein YlxR (DUF448 family)